MQMRVRACCYRQIIRDKMWREALPTCNSESRERLSKARSAEHKLDWLRSMGSGGARNRLNPLPLILVCDPLTF